VYNTFSDLENDVLAAWNRCATFFNIIRDIDVDNAKSYAAQFSNEDKARMNTILSQIREDGYENVKQRVIRGDMIFL
jgi:hypothetical protein